MEQEKQTCLEQFKTNLQEHSSNLNEVESHQILDLSNPETSLEFNNLINRLAQVDKQNIIEEIDSLFIILNRLKLYEFTSFLNLIDMNFPSLSFYFVMEARQLDEYNEAIFFINRLIKIRELNKMHLLFSPSRIRLISVLLTDIPIRMQNTVLDPVEEVFLLSLIKSSLTKDADGNNLKFSPPEHELLTPEQRRVAYVKGVMSKLKNQLMVD